MDTLALRFRLGIEVLPLTHLVTIATGDAAGTPAAPGTQLTLGTSLLGRLIAIPPGIWLQILKLLWLPHGPTLTTHLPLALTLLILLHWVHLDFHPPAFGSGPNSNGLTMGASVAAGRQLLQPVLLQISNVACLFYKYIYEYTTQLV